MADQGKWWKLWCSSLDDAELENLTIHEWFCWVRLGAYIKRHGRDGKIRFTPPARALTNLFRVDTFEAAVVILKQFPNCVLGERNSTVTTVTTSTVTLEIEYQNWFKYQGDFSNDRVRKFRDKKRHGVTAQEEKRSRRRSRRDKEEITSTPQVGGSNPLSKTAETAAGKEYRIPDQDKDPVGFTILSYKRLKGYAYDDPKFDKSWSRWVDPAKSLLETFHGELPAALGYMKKEAEYLVSKNFHWNLDTISKRAYEWIATKGGKHVGPTDSARFSDALAHQRAKNSGESVGGLVTAKSVLGSLADQIPLREGNAAKGNPNGAENAGANPKDEKSLG